MKMLASLAFGGCLLGCVSGGSGSAGPAKPTTIFDDPARGKDREADARRHAIDLVAFTGVKAGDTVVDLIPGGATSRASSA